MPTTTILLPRQLVQQVFHQAQAAPETEICGLIGARDGVVRSCYPVANASGDPTQLFDMDAQTLINAMKEMRERGESLFAIYHSHPHAPPEPSARDREQISYPDAYYLIVSLNIKGVLEMRAWKPNAGGLREVPLKIIPDDAA